MGGLEWDDVELDRLFRRCYCVWRVRGGASGAKTKFGVRVQACCGSELRLSIIVGGAKDVELVSKSAV